MTLVRDPSVLVIGLDAACFDRLDPHLEDGTLPNLEMLLGSGVGAPLETTTPPWTPSAWPSVVTGSRPWTHGIYDFYQYGEETPRHVSARDVRVPFIWEILSWCGYASIVVNVPVTHPTHFFDGSLVPGYISPETDECLIDGAVSSISSLDESYRIYPHGDSSKEARLDEYCKLISSRATIAEELAGHHKWSFMMVQFQCTDSVFHSMGNDQNAVRTVFERVDEAIGSLLDRVENETHVFVVSDHGMHRYERTFHCNSWLRDEGYLQTSVESSRWSWNERSREELVGNEDNDELLPSLTTALVNGLSRIGVTPNRIEKGLSLVGLEEGFARLLPASLLIDIVNAGEHVDWDTSQAYCRSKASLGIRCNVKGRDPNGVVPADEFDSLRETLVEELRTITDSAGRAVFETVYDRHRVHGSDVANERSAPDIVVRPTDMVWEISDIVRERTVVETNKFNHSYDGLFIAAGDRINTDATPDPSVVDVTPTILSLFGIQPIESMDGRILEGLVTGLPADLEDPFVGTRTFVGDQTGVGVSDAVEEQLQEMGYLE